MVYQANLNFEIIRDYLKDMIAKGLMVKDGRIYHTTLEGQNFIRWVDNAEVVFRGHPVGVKDFA
jgi:predicted transcriptional regulator